MTNLKNFMSFLDRNYVVTPLEKGVHYTSLVLTHENDIDAFEGVMFNNELKLQKGWKTLEVEYQKDKKTKKLKPFTDFCLMFLPISGVNEKAKSVIEAHLNKQHFEILSLKCLNAEHRMFGLNVILELDILDHDKSDLKYFKNSKDVMKIYSYKFKKHEMEDILIFRIPETSDELYCTRNFVNIYKRNELTGLEFTKLK